MSASAIRFGQITTPHISSLSRFDTWEIQSTVGMAPTAAKLEKVANELTRGGVSYTLYQAKSLDTGAIVETIVAGDLAWQHADGNVRAGAWDEERRTIWLRGGSAVELSGSRAVGHPQSQGHDELPEIYTTHAPFAATSKREQRQHARLELSVTVQVCGDGVELATRDVSHGGAFLMVDDPYSLARHMLLGFTPRDGEAPYFLAAEVVRIEASKGVGVRFLHNSEAEQTAVSKAVRAMVIAANA